MSSSSQLNQSQSLRFQLENPELSFENSIEFVRKITLVAVSNVLFFRNIFPPSAFTNRKWEETRVRVLQVHEGIPATEVTRRWVLAAISAIKDKSLKAMMLVIAKPTVQGSQPIELYKFNYSYETDNVVCDIITESQQSRRSGQDRSNELPRVIKQSSQQLISSIIDLTSNLEPLPFKFQISMWLEIMENGSSDFKVPKEFSPKDSMDVMLPPEARTLKMGNIQMKYATFSVKSKTVMEMDAEHESDGQFDEGDLLLVPSPLPKLSQHSRSLVQPYTEKSTGDTNDVSKTASTMVLRDDEGEVNCICGCPDFVDVIKCDSCFKYQHKSCFKILANQKVDSLICVDCHEPNNPLKTCTDPELIFSKTGKVLALYRRALVLCLNARRVCPQVLVTHFNIPQKLALKLFNKLERDGCFQPGRSTTESRDVRMIDTNYLKSSVMMKRFNTAPDSDKLDSIDEDINDGPIKKRFKYATNNKN